MTQPIFLAAGGTGGHVFPAEALARELMSRGIPVHLVTDVRGKAFGDALPEVTVHRVSASTATGGLVKKITAITSILKGASEAAKLIRANKPSAVVAFGGYPCLPGALAAIFTKTPLILHDQNAVLGRANRLIAPYAHAIAKSFNNVIGLPAKAKAELTGNPVRPTIASLRDMGFVAPEPSGSIHILVTGGSQGARVFSEVVPGAIAELDEDLRKRIIISQQVRAEDLDKVRATYAAMGMDRQAELQPFFTDMPRRIAACHLFIGRAGGSTVAELAAAGRPAIYVPLPIAILDEQTHNAGAIERAGGGWIMQQKDFTPTKLAQQLRRILTDPASLAATARAAHGQGRTDAAKKLADLVLQQTPSGSTARDDAFASKKGEAA